MIARLTGILAHVSGGSIILDVNGVGYLVSVPLSSLSLLGEIGSKAILHIHTAVREDDICLYGFSTIEQKNVFEMLLTVTGVGPKVALAILSGMDVESLASALASEDIKTLTRIPGLGPKNAQRLALELGDKMRLLVAERKSDSVAASRRRPPEDLVLADAVDGLINLGYNRSDARKAAEKAADSLEDKTNTAELLKSALGILTKPSRS
jgi:Holliday junction DNA helicase RuvA